MAYESLILETETRFTNAKIKNSVALNIWISAEVICKHWTCALKMWFKIGIFDMKTPTRIAENVNGDS